MDFDQTQLLIYQHVVQLTLLDHEVDQAFALAHQVAALAFDEPFTRRGLALAAQGHGDSLKKDTASETGVNQTSGAGDEPDTTPRDRSGQQDG